MSQTETEQWFTSHRCVVRCEPRRPPKITQLALTGPVFDIFMLSGSSDANPTDNDSGSAGNDGLAVASSFTLHLDGTVSVVATHGAASSSPMGSSQAIVNSRAAIAGDLSLTDREKKRLRRQAKCVVQHLRDASKKMQREVSSGRGKLPLPQQQSLQQRRVHVLIDGIYLRQVAHEMRQLFGSAENNFLRGLRVNLLHLAHSLAGNSYRTSATSTESARPSWKPDSNFPMLAKLLACPTPAVDKLSSDTATDIDVQLESMALFDGCTSRVHELFGKTVEGRFGVTPEVRLGESRGTTELGRKIYKESKQALAVRIDELVEPMRAATGGTTSPDVIVVVCGDWEVLSKLELLFGTFGGRLPPVVFCVVLFGDASAAMNERVMGLEQRFGRFIVVERIAGVPRGGQNNPWWATTDADFGLPAEDVE